MLRGILNQRRLFCSKSVDFKAIKYKVLGVRRFSDDEIKEFINTLDSIQQKEISDQAKSWGKSFEDMVAFLALSPYERIKVLSYEKSLDQYKQSFDDSLSSPETLFSARPGLEQLTFEEQNLLKQSILETKRELKEADLKEWNSEILSKIEDYASIFLQTEKDQVRALHKSHHPYKKTKEYYANLESEEYQHLASLHPDTLNEIKI